MVRKEEIENHLPCGTVTLAENIGKVLRAANTRDKFSELARQRLLPFWDLQYVHS